MATSQDSLGGDMKSRAAYTAKGKDCMLIDIRTFGDPICGALQIKLQNVFFFFFCFLDVVEEFCITFRFGIWSLINNH